MPTIDSKTLNELAERGLGMKRHGTEDDGHFCARCLECIYESEQSGMTLNGQGFALKVLLENLANEILKTEETAACNIIGDEDV